ncbi:hypothetical protein OEZ86_011387 [Tetradesmus obliquus]|nr:hypothetical protein OEZ86_011387 [Tetradesmus obliquus]
MADEEQQQQQQQGLLGGEVQQGHIMMLDEPDVNMDAAGDEAAGSKAAMPSPEEQAAAIQELEDKQIQSGEQMYIISKPWWRDWCAYTRYKQQPDDSSSPSDTDSATQPPPQEIDNSAIVDNNSGDLQRNLEETAHFEIVTAQSWELLHSWYGGGPVVSRPAVIDGLLPHTKRARVMLYPIKLDVVWSGKPTEIKTIEAELKETVHSLKLRACAEFGVDPATIDIWDFFHQGKHAKLEGQLDKTLSDARIIDEQPILLDDKDNPLECESKSSSSPIITSSRGMFGRSNSIVQEDSTVQRSEGRPGLVGLQNLGNTCFMNSSLQCLMHTVPIMSVFLSGAYEGDLNTVNPLGMKGQLATAFGSLISNVWRPEVGTVVPRGFKARLAQFAPQFSGYAQHDSQEFLAFLLDGLHEDVNRIQAKPYIEETDSEGVPDDELARRAWDNYRLRNDSHIVDHFQGLYKSTLVCPQCGYSSVKFDPFMYLSLPLPESKVRQLTAILLHADGAAPPREYGLEVPQTGSVKDLYLALARVAGLPLAAPEQQMVAARLSQRYNYGLAVFEDPKARISELLGRDANDGALLVYYYKQPELGPAGEVNQKVVVYHRKAGVRRSYNSDDKFSAPLLMWMPLDQTYDPELHVVPSNAPGQQLGGSRSSKFADVGSPSSSSSKDVEYIVTEDAPIWRHELGTAGASSADNTAAAAAAGSGLLGQGGVPVAPLDIWSAQTQATTTTPVNTPPGSTTGTAAAGTSSSNSSWPHLQLKLARDSSDFATVVSPWFTAHFHPNAHHTTMVLDWHLHSSSSVPYQEYAAAAATAAAAAVAGQQQDAEMQQQEQHPAGINSSSSSSDDSFFWVPDVSGLTPAGAPLGDQPLIETVDICGDYCVQPLQQPEFDESTAPIKAARADPRGKAVSLEACVEAFLQPEQLSEADEWYCPKCKAHVQADKKLDLWSLPEVLVVHLKRFSYTRWNRDKLDTQVQFPLAGLDLSRYVLHAQEQPPLYDCFAVSNHYGGMGGGHYTAFGQMPNDKKWFCFDDSRVEEISPEGVQSRAAYVLFYRRRQQVQADSPSLVDDLLQQRQQHMEQKRLQQQEQRVQDDAAAAAAAAATAVGDLEPVLAPPQSPVAADVAAMDMDAPAGDAAVPLGSSPAAAGDAGGGWVGTSTAAAAARSVRIVGADSSSTSSKGLAGAAEDDGDSSDGSSSSRPQRRAGGSSIQQATSWQQQQQQQQQLAAGTGADDGAVLQGLVPQAAAMRRPSDQDADADMADMADRDV